MVRYAGDVAGRAGVVAPAEMIITPLFRALCARPKTASIQEDGTDIIGLVGTFTALATAAGGRRRHDVAGYEWKPLLTRPACSPPLAAAGREYGVRTHIQKAAALL